MNVMVICRCALLIFALATLASGPVLGYNAVSVLPAESDTKPWLRTSKGDVNATSSLPTSSPSSSAAATPELVTSHSTSDSGTSMPFRLNISSYEEAVVLSVESLRSLEGVQTVISDSFDELFVAYCQNISCPYMVHIQGKPITGSLLYIVVYLEAGVNNAKGTMELTLTVLHLKSFLPDDLLVDFFKANAHSFSGIEILNAVTYASVQPPNPSTCEDTSGYVAAIIALAVVSVVLLVIVLVLAYMSYMKSRTEYHESGAASNAINMTSSDNEKSYINDRSQSRTYN